MWGCGGNMDDLGGRWEFFTDEELLAIHGAAWVEDQEYGMSEPMTTMMPDIEKHLDHRGWTQQARYNGKKEQR